MVAQRLGHAQQNNCQNRKLSVEAFKETCEARDHPQQEKRRREDEGDEQKRGIDQRGDDFLSRGFAEFQVAHVALDDRLEVATFLSRDERSGSSRF